MATKQIICDTDVMIEFWKSSSIRHSKTKDIVDSIGVENIILSAVTKMELLFGAVNKNDLSKLKKNLAPFFIALINDEITLKALSLLEKYSLSHKLSIADSLIASTAIVTNLELFTYNNKDYKFIPDLKLYKVPGG